MQKRRGKFRREGANTANSTFAERWAFLRNNLIVTRSEVGKGAQKNTSMAARRRFRPFRRGSFAPMAQRKSIIKKRDAETSKGIPLYGGSHGNASAKDNVSHIEQMPGSMEIVGTSSSSMHDHLHLRRKGTALHSSPHLNIRAVAAWLKKIGLLNYEKVFLDHGWDDMTSIRSLLNEEELMRMGITKRGHVLRILKAVADPLFGDTNTATERVGEDHIVDDRKNLRAHCKMPPSPLLAFLLTTFHLRWHLYSMRRRRSSSHPRNTLWHPAQWPSLMSELMLAALASQVTQILA